MESLDLAKKHGYQDGEVERSPDPHAANPLPDDYFEESEPIAEPQMVLAGYRLADILGELYPRP